MRMYDGKGRGKGGYNDDSILGCLAALMSERRERKLSGQVYPVALNPESMVILLPNPDRPMSFKDPGGKTMYTVGIKERFIEDNRKGVRTLC